MARVSIKDLPVERTLESQEAADVVGAGGWSVNIGSHGGGGVNWGGGSVHWGGGQLGYPSYPPAHGTPHYPSHSGGYYPQTGYGHYPPVHHGGYSSGSWYH